MSSVNRQGSVCRHCGHVNPLPTDTTCRKCLGLVLCDADQVPAIRRSREEVESVIGLLVRKVYLGACEKNFSPGIRKH